MQSLTPINFNKLSRMWLISAFARLWLIIGWVWSSIIIGGFVVSLIVSYVTTGTIGITKADPRSWFLLQPLFAHPLGIIIAIAFALTLTLCAYISYRIQQKALKEEKEEYHKAVMNIGRGVHKLLEDVKTNPAYYHLTSPDTKLSLFDKDTKSSDIIWNVPYRRNPFFTGRDELLNRIHNKLSLNTTIALSQAHAISGLGGIGKTQTAIEYAYRYREKYRYILWVRASARETLVSDFIALANQLSLPEKEEQDQNRVVVAVKRWLATQEDWLLIFDNADDLAMASDFFPPNENGHILLTTRAQYGGSLANMIELEVMDKHEGVLLLLRRAKLIEPKTKLEQIPSIYWAEAESIVTMLAGLPLALDQAGAFIEETLCSLSEFIKLYQIRRKELLQRRGSLPSDHPEPVATTWSLSFQKIEQANPVAADLLRLCAFFDPDVIPEEIIQEATELGPILSREVANAFSWNQAIEELRKFSLVRRNPDTKMLNMHRLVQVILKDGMPEKEQYQWAERTVRATNEAFPLVKMATWSQCERYLSQAQVCEALIKQYDFTFSEATDLLDKLSSYFYSHAQYEQAETLAMHTLNIRQKVLGPEHPDTSVSLDSLATLYHAQGKFELAESMAKLALNICEQSLGPEHPDTSVSLDSLASLYHDQGKFEEAEPLAKRALVIRERVLGPEHIDTATSLTTLARLYHAQGKYGQAEPLYLQILSICEKALGPEHYITATSLNNLAALYHAQGKFEQAKPLAKRALSIREQILGLEHPDTIIAFNNLLKIFERQSKYKLIELLHIHILDVWEQLFKPEYLGFASIFYSLASFYSEQGEYEQAELLYQHSITIREKILGPEHPDTAKNINYLALLYSKQGKYEQAELLYQRSITIREKVLGPEHPDTALSHNNLAVLYGRMGKYKDADQHFHHALSIYERILGQKHPEYIAVLKNYIVLLKKSNRGDVAKKLEARIYIT